MSDRNEELKAAQSRAKTMEELATQAEAIAAKSQAEATWLKRRWKELDTAVAREEWMQAQVTANIEAQMARDVRFQAYCTSDHSMGWEAAISGAKEMNTLVKAHRAKEMNTLVKAHRAKLAADRAAKTPAQIAQDQAESEEDERAEYEAADQAELKKFRIEPGHG